MLYCLYMAHAATGFCNREIITTEKGMKFDWPETVGGTNSTVRCPNGATVTRCCAVGGLWQEVNYDVCITGEINYNNNNCNNFNSY